MVTTRSGVKVRKHGVRFKKGSAVRRILEYDDSYGYETDDESLYSDSELNNNKLEGTLKGILLNSTGIRNDSQFEYASQDDPVQGEGNSLPDGTILYDVYQEERKRLGSLCLDTFVFLLITLACYFTASLIYVHWGYKLYLLVSVLCIIIFSYNITYYDSMKPGVMPPSPISPMYYSAMIVLAGHKQPDLGQVTFSASHKSYKSPAMQVKVKSSQPLGQSKSSHKSSQSGAKHSSGHSYHLSYVMSVINGLIFLLIEPYILNIIVPPL